MPQTIAVITSTRAEYGLLRPVLLKLAAEPAVRLELLVTGAHISPAHGNTVTEIEKDGLPIAARLPILNENELDEPVALTIARTVQVFEGWFAENRPDILLVLGDRYEIFAACTAAAARHIPIAHISGGDVTLGAADEYYRHCITKMASVHFPSCVESAERLVRLGEEPRRVFCVGGLGDENIRTLPKMSRAALCESTGFPLERPFALVTYHPETAGAGAADPAAQAEELIEAMKATPGIFWLITGSNADEGGQICTAKMKAFAAANPEKAGFIQSLGLLRYLSAMEQASLVAGNSSSGVVETPSFRVPTVNIGNRQAGRAICANVLCCPAEKEALKETIQKALSPAFKAKATTARSPYEGGDTSGQIVALLEKALMEGELLKTKTFYDGPVPSFTVGGTV